MAASIKTKLLLTCILLVLFSTLGISISSYILIKRDKHNDSQQRIQIAFEIIRDDFTTRRDLYQDKLNDFFTQISNLGWVSLSYLEQERAYFSLLSNLSHFVRAAEDLEGFGRAISADRLLLYGMDKRLLMVYQRHESKETIGGYVVAESGNDAYLALDDYQQFLQGKTSIPDNPLPDGLTAHYAGDIPESTSIDLIREGSQLSLRISLPMLYNHWQVGFVVCDVFYTQSMIERFARLSKTDISFLSGDSMSVSTLPVQQAQAIMLPEQPVSCEALLLHDAPADLDSVLLDREPYYQGQCAIRNGPEIIGAMAVNFSKVLEQQAIQKILNVVSAIMLAGIILNIFVISLLVVPHFTKPIISLSRASEQIALGNLDEHIAQGGQDELGVLARNFAYMRGRIKRTIEELHQLNIKLEQRVRERTAELTRQKYILDAFMANVPDSIYFKDRKSRFIRGNRSLARILGIEDPKALVGKSDFDFFPPEDAQFKYDREQEILNTGTLLLNQEESYAGGGWALSTKMPLRDEHGEIIGTFGISRDITSLKQTEQELIQYREHLQDLVEERTAELTRTNTRLEDEILERTRMEGVLRSSEEQYRLLAENVKDGIVIVQNETCVFVNKAFSTMTGYETKSLLTQQPIHLFHERSASLAAQRLAVQGKDIPKAQWQAELNTREQRIIWAEVEQSDIVWNSQPALLLTVHDITDRKRREKRLEEERSRLEEENLTLKSSIRERYRFGMLVGKSPAMQHVYELIVSAASSDVNVLIAGESGTGKELIARTFHQVSRRKDRAFVPVNCASIPESLFEREFFGHRKGAFTGADRDTPGLFDKAHQGTLFLDEVTELPLSMQAKLLRVLQDGEYTPLGSTSSRRADVLLVTATNKDCQEEIKAKRLRKDFFYRIGVIDIQVPPLRERKDDLPLLIEHILEEYHRKHTHDEENSPAPPNSQIILPADLVQALYVYDWPGNVRELQNLLQRYVATQDLPAVLSLLGASNRVRSLTEDLPTEDGRPLRETLESFERHVISSALQRNHFHIGKTAERLGVPRVTLHRKIKKHQIKTKI